MVYVPYGDGIMLANGKMGSFQQSDCAALQDAWLNCNAPGGAARLFNANNKSVIFLRDAYRGQWLTRLVIDLGMPSTPIIRKARLRISK